MYVCSIIKETLFVSQKEKLQLINQKNQWKENHDILLSHIIVVIIIMVVVVIALNV